MTEATAAPAAPNTAGSVSTATAAGGGRRLTPSDALRRHIEWLEFALAAARSEETWRARRVDKATKRNRDRRTTRLAEVREEIDELTALLEGIKDLQRLAARPAMRSAQSGRGSGAAKRKPPAPTTRRTPAGSAAGRTGKTSAPSNSPGMTKQRSVAGPAPSATTRAASSEPGAKPPVSG